MFEITREQVTTMQDKQITNINEGHPQHLSLHERHLASEIKELLLALHNLSPETIDQLISAFFTSYQEIAVQTIAEQFMLAIKSHLVQLAALFELRAEHEGIRAEDRDETVQDMKEDILKIIALNQRLRIDSLEDLFKLGKIVVGAKDLTWSNTADEAQSSLYNIFTIYQGRLERAYLIRKMQ